MRPLEGIRILDFTHVLAGPFATRILADMGADVVKVNSRERAANNAAGSPYYTMWNRNKRALALNMSHPDAVATCRRLAMQADVVINNFSLGVMDRWGVGYDTISAANKGVIYVEMSGMGKGGPWSDFVTFAPTIHALAGITHTTGEADHAPIGVGFSYNDHQAGLHAAVAILAAVEAREHSGKGQHIDFSQFEVGVSMLGPVLLDYFANGVIAEPCGNKLPHDRVAPHGTYECLGNGGDDILDENWIAIACMTDEHWSALCGVMGNPKWAAASRFATCASRYAASEEIDAQLRLWTAEHEAVSLMDRLQRAGVPAGVVQTGIDMVEFDPQLRHANFLSMGEELHPVIGPTFVDRLPIHFEKTPCDTYKRSRTIGEDNDAVLHEWLGLSAQEIKDGEESGVFT